MDWILALPNGVARSVTLKLGLSCIRKLYHRLVNWAIANARIKQQRSKYLTDL